MTMRDIGAMPMAAMICLVAVMLSGCISRDAAKQECKTKDGGNMFVVRIAEIEVHPEWLEAYLAAAETVGAESVAKEQLDGLERSMMREGDNRTELIIYNLQVLGEAANRSPGESPNVCCRCRR